MRIDPHVHCRDGRQKYKETIEHVLRLCDRQGIDIVFDMPNTEPPILAAADLEARLALVPRDDQLRYKIFMGATTDEKQLEEAASLAKNFNQVAGIKMYAGRSVGRLAVINENLQRKVYEVLAGLDYRGVLAVHCEKERLCRSDFDPQRPISHCECRPPEAEIKAIQDQIQMVRGTGFKGHLHITHVSTAESVALIRSVRAGIKITCGVTPHHLLWSNTQMINKEGLLYKVNPPLRDMSDCIALRYALKEGNIDWIETDHAPHPICEKLYPPYASGYPSLCLYGNLVDNILPMWGIDKNMIADITCNNIKRVFMERSSS
jgi:dihydroorotase